MSKFAGVFQPIEDDDLPLPSSNGNGNGKSVHPKSELPPKPPRQKRKEKPKDDHIAVTGKGSNPNYRQSSVYFHASTHRRIQRLIQDRLDDGEPIAIDGEEVKDVADLVNLLLARFLRQEGK